MRKNRKAKPLCNKISIYPFSITVLFFKIFPETNAHLFGDVTVLVDVVEVEGPVELLRDRTSEQNRQADDEVLEADRAVSVDVERVEEEVSVGGCICGQGESLIPPTAFTGSVGQKCTNQGQIM